MEISGKVVFGGYKGTDDSTMNGAFAVTDTDGRAAEIR